MPAELFASAEVIVTPPLADRILIRGGTVLTMDPSVGDFATADVLIEGRKIVSVATTIEASAEVLDARGMIVIPGLVDAHRHHWSGMFKCGLPNADGTAYGNLADRIMPFLREQDVYDITRLTNASAIDCGITCILDYMHGSKTADLTNAAVSAHFDSGIRSVFAFATPRPEHMNPASLMTCGCSSGLDVESESSATPHHPTYVHVLKREFFSSEDQLVSLRLGTPLLSRNFALARELDLKIISDAIYGGPTPIRPVDAAPRLREMAKAGELGPDVTLIHCTLLPDDVFQLLADHGVCVVLVPTSDASLRGLGDSVPPIQKVMDFGLLKRTGLSVDIEVSLSPDLFAQMRAVLVIQRLLANQGWAHGTAKPARNISVREVLGMATIGGATAIGTEKKCGSLTPGKEADIVLIRATDVTTGPLNNAFGTVVVGANVNNVDTVIIGGKIKKCRGQLIGVDQSALVDRVRESRDYLAQKSGAWAPASIVQ
jgi:cytosine/adenosine deaminase-related metal-dependent hydrolase